MARDLGLEPGDPLRRQVLPMVGVEAAVVALIGVVLGTAVAAATRVPFSRAVSGSGWPVGPVWVYPAVVGTAVALVLAATLVPAWPATRTRPAPAPG